MEENHKFKSIEDSFQFILDVYKMEILYLGAV